MKKIAALISFALAALVPTAAFAYVGPGAGLSLLGALWALIAAVGTVLIFIVAWPVRRMLRRRRAANNADARQMEAAPQAQADKQSR
ncbi:hypothetical protein [Chelativorans salis]|uniref:Uncharacterized protein n=1 Tax=Chelativorans salis TaxID=2978478 RepID=A0ABT2LGQ4_9HYPH|nr:hypothetical protein [Chelativorans sp. EGI FJ00035]MCT7373691.1 hypothetical protein [Chelativorans sp. EGI FJ00035]